jgi:hypothetical protein
MSNASKFFHDRLNLFLLTVNSFLVVVSVIIILLRIGGAQDTYIHSYRSNLGLSAIAVGGVGEIIAFVLFAVGLFVIHIFMALEFHKIRRASAWVVMLLTMLLLILNLIVANALLDLR